MSQRRV